MLQAKEPTMADFEKLPDSAMVRQSVLVQHPNPARRALHAPLIDMSASTLWRQVAAGTFPAPLKLGKNITAWRVKDVRDWLAKQKGGI